MASKIVVLIIGGTGAQGAAIIKVLASTGRYYILAPTRDTTTQQAKELAAFRDVEVLPSHVQSGYNEVVFSEVAARADAVFLNIDGLAIGEMAETFWGIRLFELSARAGVKHLIFSGLDYNGRKCNYNPELYAVHYEGKARIQEWMHAQGKDFPMAWTIIRSGPYAENLSEAFRPTFDDDGTAVFQLPLGDGEVPFVSLEDFGRYVDWALSNPDQSRGLDFGISIEHTNLETLAAAYRHVTGKRARTRDIPIAEWSETFWSKLPKGKDTKIGFQAVKDDALLTLTFEQSFTHFWNLYKESKGNVGLITRDYAFLDKILPSRYRSMQDWMQRTGYTGRPVALLKNAHYSRAQENMDNSS